MRLRLLPQRLPHQNILQPDAAVFYSRALTKVARTHSRAQETLPRTGKEALNLVTSQVSSEESLLMPLWEGLYQVLLSISVLPSVRTFVLDPCLPLDEDMERKNEVFGFILPTDPGIDSLST